MRRGRALEERLGSVESHKTKQKGEQEQAHAVSGKAVFAGKVRSARGDQQIEGADELSDGELEEEQTGDEARKGGEGDGGRQETSPRVHAQQA